MIDKFSNVAFHATHHFLSILLHRHRSASWDCKSHIIWSIACTILLAKNTKTIYKKSNTQMKSIILILAAYFCASVQAFCFYDLSSNPIRVVPIGHTEVRGQFTCIKESGPTAFDQTIQPSGKACWLWSQFTSSPCNSLTYAIAPVWAISRLEFDQYTYRDCWISTNGRSYDFKAGDGVTVNLDSSTINRYPNAQCN